MTAPTASSIVLLNTPKRLVVKFMALFADADETAAVKVDKSAYTGLNGLEPDHFLIEKIEAHIGDSINVTVLVDHTSPLVVAYLSSKDVEMCYRETGGLSTAGAGSTGDIQFTTHGGTSATSNDSYDITLYLKKVDSSASL